MLPGMNQFASQIDSVDTDGVFKTYEAIINSMTHMKEDIQKI